MWLPDWARFCDRCGTPVEGAEQDDSSWQAGPDEEPPEPLWDEADEGGPQHAEEQGGRTVAIDQAAEQPQGGLTMPMPVEVDADDEPGPGDEDAAAEDLDAPEDGSAEQTEAPVADDSADDGPTDDEALQDEAPSGDEEAAVQGEAYPEPAEPLAQPGAVEKPLAVDVVHAPLPENYRRTGTRRSRVVVQQRDRQQETETDRTRSLLTILAVFAAIALGFGVAFMVLGRSVAPQAEEAPKTESVKSKKVSKRVAGEIIAQLDGWWKTDRTYDGRYWHFESGDMKVYAANAELASEVQIDPGSIERASSGPGDIEGVGYYLRDVAFYLCDDEPDTLYAIGQDGVPDQEANLKRCDPPAYVAEDGTIRTKEQMEAEAAAKAAEEEERERSTYILPESDTRAYEWQELEGMSDHDLFFARYEIFARHGYNFYAYDDLTTEMSEYFNSRTWYQPTDYFNEGEITSVEWQNWSTIQSIEQSRNSPYGWRYV